MQNCDNPDPEIMYENIMGHESLGEKVKRKKVINQNF